ncbi:hypothetical protein Tco_1304600 [Tanacetum coccineum]
MTDAKDMWIAIKSRFGGNDESKKMQKYILKQQFEGFTVSNSDGIHKEDYERSPKVKTQSARDSSSRDIIMNSDGFKSDQEGIYNAKNSTTKWSLLKKEQNNARLLLKATDKRKDNYEEVIAPMARHLKHKELFSICLPIWVYSISNGCEEMPFSMARFDEELQELGMHTFIHFLVKNGYDEVTIDKTHFLKKDKPRYHFSQEFYVDDIIFDYKKVLVVMISGFDENRFQMSSMGELTSFLAYKSNRTNGFRSAKEIKLLKAKNHKAQKGSLIPDIKHIKAYQKRISKEQRHQRNLFSKEEEGANKVCIQTREEECKGDGKAKENAQSKGRTKEMMDEDKETDEFGLSTKMN